MEDDITPQAAVWIAATGLRAVGDERAAELPDHIMRDTKLSLMARGLYALVLSGGGAAVNPFEDAVEPMDDIRGAIDELVAAELVVEMPAR